MSNANTSNMKALFEQKAQEAAQTKTNAEESKTNRKWTPHNDGTGVGAHNATGFAKQTRGPPKKRSLADLP